MYQVATFYHFTPLAGLIDLKTDLNARAQALDICGTFLLAPEGVNATLAGLEHENFTDFIQTMMDQFRIPSVNLKWSRAKDKPFQRLKVRVKKETITMKRPDVNVAARTGIHVAPQDWNDLINEPDVLLLDTRNQYETSLGTFTGAKLPLLDNFSQFADYVDGLDPNRHPRVAMFCTGGIRCEKASSYMLSKGFREVYQLQGGILKYLETIPSNQSQWQGECFVFDERLALRHGLQEHQDRSDK